MNVQALSGVGRAYQQLENTVREEREFRQVMKELDAYLESQKKTEAEKRREEQAALEKKAKAKKIMELQLRISAARSRVSMGDESAEGELSSLQNQLFLLQLFG